MIKKILLSLLFVLVGLAPVVAQDALNSRLFKASYREPSHKEPVGSAEPILLNDLAYTTIYYTEDDGERIEAFRKAAGTVGGGRFVNVEFYIEGLEDGATIAFVTTATNLSSAESRESVAFNVILGSLSSTTGKPPLPPTQLTVTEQAQ